MTAAARAFSWELFRRRRWGFAAVGLYVVMLAAARLSWATNSFALMVIVPGTACFLYLLAVFSFGLTGDLAARESMYPSRLFTLPITSREMVAWPMGLGMATLALLWMAIAVLGLRPSGLHVAVLWPALFAAVFLGWAQALTWMPYGLRGIRVIVAAAWLITVDTIVVASIVTRAPASFMIAFLAPQLPIVYGVGYYAIRRARSGRTPDWVLQIGNRKLGISPARSFAGSPFSFEFRANGLTLPAIMLLLLPFELSLLFLSDKSDYFVGMVLAMVLLTPVFMAACTAATMRDALTTFIATRPLTDRALVGSRLAVAAISTVLTWLVVVGATTLALIASHDWHTITHLARSLSRYMGAPRAIALGGIFLAWLMLLTWKQLVQSLFIALTGRDSLRKVVLFGALVALIFVIPGVDFIAHSTAMMAKLWGALRWVLAALVLLKLAASTWTLSRLQRGRLVPDESLLAMAATWLLSVLSLHAFLLWLFAAPQMPAYVLMLVAILIVPFARIAAAPLALAWNRHR